MQQTLMMQTADAMVSEGLLAAGYVRIRVLSRINAITIAHRTPTHSMGLSCLQKYCNVDDCWAASRNSSNYIVADARTFPDGMTALAAYIHRKGLLAGLYTDLGSRTCAGRPGSLGYEAIDAATYASWGFDYVKVCPTNPVGLDCL